MKSLVSIALDRFITCTTNLCARRRLLLLLLGYGFLANSQPVSAADCVPRPAGLVSWWRGESNALDQAGSNNGTLAGNTIFSSGRVGQGFVFDGNGAVVQLGNPANLHFQDLTIEAWIRRASTAVASLNGNGNGVIFGYHIGGYGLYMDPNGTPTLSKIGINEVKPGVTITDTNLHHVAVTKSGSTVVFYVDGVAFPAAAYDPGFTFSENAFIGGLENQYTFYGTVDEVSVYSRALAAGEIQAVYSASSAGKCVPNNPTNNCAPAPPGLVGWWKGESNAADTLGNNHGQLTSATTFAPGQVGQAIVFDGKDGALTVPASTSLNVGLGAGLTIEAWIKPATIELERPIVEWNSVTGGNPWPYGVHFWISVPVGYGAGPGCLYVNLVDTAGNFHWLTSAGGLINTNSFQHVAVTYDQSSGLAVLLLNGAVVAQQNLGSFTPQTSYNLFLGNRPGGAAAAFRWSGLMDEVSLYARALSTSELQAIYAAGRDGKCLPTALPPSITQQPQSVTTNANASIQFDVVTTGVPAPSFQWFYAGNPLAGQTGASLLLNDVQPNQAGSYFVIVTNTSGAVTSSIATLTVLTFPPLIARQPTNVTVFEGGSAIFPVQASGTAPLSYQWFFGGVPLAGKTTATLSLTNIQFTNAGNYAVIISSPYGTATSSPALLTVNPRPPCAPVHDGLVSWWRGENDSTDNWGTNNGTRFGTTFAPGKVGQAFKVPRISASDALSLRATNGLTLEAWVNPVSFLNPTPQTIISKFDLPLATPPGTQSAYLLGFTNNGQLFFKVSATGSVRTNTTLVTTQSTPSNQWSFVVATYDGAALRIYLNGTLAAQTNYSAGIFPGTAPLGLGAIFMNAQFSDASWPFTGLLDEASLYNRALTDSEILAIYQADVVGKCLVAPTIATQPQDQAIPLGEDVKFTVSVFGSRPLKFQWRFNGAVIAGATNAALVLEKVNTNQAGLYHVAVTNAVGFAVSARAQLSLLPAPTCTDTPAGLISWWPGDGNAADAMGTNSITVFSPTRYVTGKVDRAFSFNGASSRFQVNNSTPLNFGSNANFAIETWIKVLPLSGTVLPINGPNLTNTPIIEKRSALGSTGIGYSLSLNAGRLAFWLGSSPISSTNGSVFISSGPDLRDAMFHHVAVSLERNSTTGGKLYVDGQLVLTFDPTPRREDLSNTGALLIGAPTSPVTGLFFSGLIDEPAIYKRALTAEEIFAIRLAGAAGKCKVEPSILVQPVSQTATAGSNITVSVTAIGSPKLGYQWFVEGQSIPGATSSAFTSAKRPLPPKKTLTYFVRVTNLFGAITSFNAVVIFNQIPRVHGYSTKVNEDEQKPFTLFGSDSDGDALTFTVSNPAHGTIMGAGSNYVYTPAPNYNGPDAFTYKANDGLVDSALATINLTVLPVNDPPVALSQLITLDEDTAIPITLGAFDADGDALTYSVTPPAHGTLSGVAPNLNYTPATNYFGSDLFTFTVRDPSNAVSQLAAVSITVRPVNDAPVARIEVAPLDELPGITNLVAIAPVCCEATLRLDASKSTDVENDALTYTWLEGTNILSTEVVVTNLFKPGTHEFTLLVNDGKDVTAAFVTVEIITSAEAVAFLKGLVEAGIPEDRDRGPLVNWLREAGKAFDRCKVEQGVRFLEFFNQRIQARIAPTDAELATALMATATAIIEAAPDCDPCHRLGRHHHKRGKDKERDGRDERGPGFRSERDDQTDRPGARGADAEVRGERSSPKSR